MALRAGARKLARWPCRQGRASRGTTCSVSFSCANEVFEPTPAEAPAGNAGAASQRARACEAQVGAVEQQPVPSTPHFSGARQAVCLVPK